MPKNLSIEIVEPAAGQNYQVVKFVGDFDKAGYAEVHDDLQKFLSNFNLKNLIFDFKDLKYINSEGIGFLMEVHTHLVQRDRSFIVLGLNDHVKDVFAAIGIAQLIPIFDDLNSYFKSI